MKTGVTLGFEGGELVFELKRFVVKLMRFYLVLLTVLLPKVVRAEVIYQNLKPEEVLVIANAASSDSMLVAAYYMERRKIPAGHLFTIDFPKHRHHRAISQQDFQDEIVAPLQSFLEEKGLKRQILAFVSVYDVPYKVRDRSVYPKGIKNQILKKEAEIRKRIRQKPKYHIKIPKLRRQIKALNTRLVRVEGLWASRFSALHASEKKRAKQVLSVEASVDSELAWLYRRDVDLAGDKPEAAYYGRSRNLYFGQKLGFRAFREEGFKRGLFKKIGLLYMTARLEGPSVAISKALIDSAIAAEQQGPEGIGCFDAKKSTLGRAKKGYDLGDYWVRRAYIETVNAGFSAKLNEEKALFEKNDCANALFYWGWYRLSQFTDHFGGGFPPGAIAVHTASAEAKDIRKFEPGQKNPWCAGLLSLGVSFCAGPINEPFLDAFPHAEIFYARLLDGWSISEAYWASEAYTSWMMVMIGDPLYAPFAGKNKRLGYVRTGIFFQPSGKKRKETVLQAGSDYALNLFLAARTPIFKKDGLYRISGIRTSLDKVFEVLDQSQVRFEVRSEGRLLTISGLNLQIGKTGSLRLGEVEVRVDLGDGLGEKIISQQFKLSP